MNNHMQTRIAEATRLTRAGRLAEATALIQRTLGGLPTTNVSAAGPSHADAPIEAEFRVLDDSSGQFVGKVYANAAGSRRDVKVERGQVANGHAYTRSIYHDVSGRTIVEKWIVHQEGTPVVHLPIQRDPMPLPRWYAISTSIPGGPKSRPVD